MEESQATECLWLDKTLSQWFDSDLSLLGYDAVLISK
jgi:hypothetical protein